MLLRFVQLNFPLSGCQTFISMELTVKTSKLTELLPEEGGEACQ